MFTHSKYYRDFVDYRYIDTNKYIKEFKKSVSSKILNSLNNFEQNDGIL